MSNNGGSAFPWCGDLNECPAINLGMTLRDYFAAKALPASIQFCERERWEWAAERAYRIADAMLKERAK
jgi:hypothetical protein